MKPFQLFAGGAFILMLVGLLGTIINEKAHFLLWLCDCRHPVLDYYFYYITMLGEEYAFIFFGLLLWIMSWKRMITIPILGGVVMLVSYLSKLAFQHERPSLYLEKIGWEGPMTVMDYQVLSGYHSFPSGHSMAAWALFTLMAAHIKKTWFSILALFLATSVSISRVYLMVHFLQDVVAGAMIGFSLGYAVYYAYITWQKPSLSQTGSYL